jgi:DNA-directed RNA polymerase subunit RPC12/RpoP
VRPIVIVASACLRPTLVDDVNTRLVRCLKCGSRLDEG